MAVLKRGTCVQWAEVAGRHVKLKSLGGVQSINVCTSTNQPGVYEEVQYLKPGHQMSVDQVGAYGVLDSLKAELRRRAYRQSR